MKKLSTYLVVMFMIVFWIIRIIVTISAQIGTNFMGMVPFNEAFEIAILFATLLCIILIAKRKMLGCLAYIALHAIYYGADVTNKLNLIANNEKLTLTQSTELMFSIIGIILPLIVLIDLLLDKNRKENFIKMNNLIENWMIEQIKIIIEQCKLWKIKKVYDIKIN